MKPPISRTFFMIPSWKLFGSDDVSLSRANRFGGIRI